MIIQFSLPFPDAALSPNKRHCWQQKIKPKQAAFQAGHAAAFPFKGQLDPARLIKTTLLFCPADRRQRDLDNLLSASKAMLDGMAQALGINDKMLRPITIDFCCDLPRSTLVTLEQE